MSATQIAQGGRGVTWTRRLRGLLRQFDWRIPLALGATYVFFGSGAAAIKAAIMSFPPLGLGAIRGLIAGTLLLVWGLRSGTERPSKRQLLRAAAVGVLMLAVGNSCGMLGQRTIPSGIAGVLSALLPLVASCLGYVLFREKLARKAVIGLAVGFGGVALLLRPGSNLDPFGLMLIGVGQVAWALGAVLAPRLGLPEDPRVAAGAELLGGGAVVTVVAAAWGDFGAIDLGAVKLESWAGFGWLIISAVAGFTAYGYLAGRVSCAVATTFSYVNPVIAMFLGWLLFAEPVTWLMVLAITVIVAGVCLIVSTRTESPCYTQHPLTSGVGHIYIVRGRGKPLLLVDVPASNLRSAE